MMRFPRPQRPLAPARILSGLVLLSAWAGAGLAAEWQSLLNNSPFGGGSAEATPATPSGQVEFRGVVREDGVYLVNLYDPGTKTSQWIPVEGRVPGLQVSSYDAASDKVVVLQGTRQLTLPLVQSKVALQAAAPAEPAGPVAGNRDGGGRPDREDGSATARMRAQGGIDPRQVQEFIRNLPPEAQAMVEEMRRRRSERFEEMRNARPQGQGDRATPRQR